MSNGAVLMTERATMRHGDRAGGTWDMNDYQKSIFAEIQEMKRTPGHDKKALAKLVKYLVAPDNREWELKKQYRRNDPGGRSRSPSWGKWEDYSNSY